MASGISSDKDIITQDPQIPILQLHISKTDLNNASNIVAMVFLFRNRGVVMKVSVNGLTL